MTKEWHILVSKGSNFKRTYGWMVENELKVGEPNVVRRQKILYDAVDIHFDPTLIVDDIVYDRIEYDQSFMLATTEAIKHKKIVKEMIESIVTTLKNFASRAEIRTSSESFREKLGKEIDAPLFMSEIKVLEIGEQLLRNKMREWADAKDFKIQRHWNNSKSVLRIVGGALGGALATVSAVGAGGGLGIIGALFAWYGCIRTVIGAHAEIKQAYKGIYALIAQAEALKDKGYHKGKKGAIKSGAMRGFVGTSTVDTLQNLLSVIAQVKMKLAHFKEKEVILAASLNKLLDAQEVLKEARRIEKRIANARIMEIDFIIPELEAKMPQLEEKLKKVSGKEKVNGKEIVLENIKTQLTQVRKKIDDMLLNYTGGKVQRDPHDDSDDARFITEPIRGSKFIEDWIDKQKDFVSENNRVGGKLHLVENVTSTLINLGLNTAAGTALTYAPVHDSVKSAMAVNPVAAYYTDIKDVLMDPNNSLDAITKQGLLDVLDKTFQTPVGIDPVSVANTALFDLEQLGLLVVETVEVFSKSER